MNNCKNFNIEKMVEHINTSIAGLIAAQVPLADVTNNVNYYKNILKNSKNKNTKFDSVCYLIWASTRMIMSWEFTNDIEILTVYDFLESIGDTKNSDIVLNHLYSILNQPISQKLFELQDTHSQKEIGLMAFSLFKTPPNFDYARFKNYHTILTSLIS